MAQCATCGKQLMGKWELSSRMGEGRTGRYLGIIDGYFLCNNQANWVSCYCLKCFREEVQGGVVKRLRSSSFDLAQHQQQQLEKVEVSRELSSLHQQHTNLSQEIRVAQQTKANLSLEITTLQQQVAALQQMIKQHESLQQTLEHMQEV